MEAGNKLLNQGFYTQSVHHFYYAVIQMMKYQVAHLDVKKGRISYEEQSSTFAAGRGSSHDWLLAYIKDHFPFKNWKAIAKFSADFTLLKIQRVNADYKALAFSMDESAKCQELAFQLLYQLK
jgi:hypothetical protein